LTVSLEMIFAATIKTFVVGSSATTSSSSKSHLLFLSVFFQQCQHFLHHYFQGRWLLSWSNTRYPTLLFQALFYIFSVFLIAYICFNSLPINSLTDCII
jgi:hypothetical protein